MPERREEQARPSVVRRAAPWGLAAVLAVAVVASLIATGALWLKERLRMRQLAEDLSSPESGRRQRVEAALLELGDGAEAMLERIVRSAPQRTRGECERILREARRTPRGPVEESLLWLARHQDSDGSWNPAAFSRHCVGTPCTGPGQAEFTAGLTGLSLLAFLGAGYSHLSAEMIITPNRPGRVLFFGRVVRKALGWLLEHQAWDGSIEAGGPRGLINHSIAAQALSEAYGMTASQSLQAPAQRAIDYLVASRLSGKGWATSAGGDESHVATTGWALLALMSAEYSDLPFPPTAPKDALAWVEGLAGPNRPPAEKEIFENRSTLEAMALLAGFFVRKNKTGFPVDGPRGLIEDLPEWTANRIDFVSWHFGALATFKLDGPKGPIWTHWQGRLQEALFLHQRAAPDGCANGSWDPEEDRWGSAGGRIYAVALNSITLQLYYRYLHVFQAAGSEGKK